MTRINQCEREGGNRWGQTIAVPIAGGSYGLTQ